jgi:hypothetical protein
MFCSVLFLFVVVGRGSVYCSQGVTISTIGMLN